MTQTRQLDQLIKTHFEKYPQVAVILGARQVGKTTLTKRLFPDAIYLDADIEPIKQNLERYDPVAYRQILGRSKIVIIDEAQRLSDPGRTAKIFHDHLPDLKVILTGSSSLRLRSKTSESLAGRKIEYHLYPLTIPEYLFQKGINSQLDTSFFGNLSQGTLVNTAHTFDQKSLLNHLSVYGLYPSTIDQGLDTTYQTNLADSVIFKDLLDFNLIENRPGALALIKLLAHQIGQLVNYSDLANRSGLDQKTVRRYLQLFEDCFLIFRLYPYHSTKRDEIGKSPKVYFYDNGLRNALISNFQPTEGRSDTGQLFENLVISEVVKQNSYQKSGYELKYWRTKQGSEIDLVLERQDQLIGAEIKISARRTNSAFKSRYPQAKTLMIHQDNLIS